MLKRIALPAPSGVQQSGSPLEKLYLMLDDTSQRCRQPLICVSCHNPVTTVAERFAIDGKSSFHFVNPNGYQFDLCVYRNALGCYPSGTPNRQHSWFEPYSWQYAQCDQCELHLGWYYIDENGDSFWGLINALLSKA